MNDNPQPVTIAPTDVNPHRTPRFIDHATMRDHQENQRVTLLATRERHRMFVRYDGVWWIGDVSGFTEITSQAHNAKLDRWHQRLTTGALWT